MGFGKAISTCFSKYAEFDGRATRSEFWFWQLFVWLVFIALVAIFLYVANSLFRVPGPEALAERAVVALLPFMFWLAIFLPSLAVHVRRLHDINLSGFFVLLALIPLGALALFVMAFIPGSEGANAYGPAAKN